MSQHRRKGRRQPHQVAQAEPLPVPVHPEFAVADLLGAASAWAAIHPKEAAEALRRVFAAAGIPETDARYEACKRAVKKAIGGPYGGTTALRLAALFADGGPRAITSAFHRASVTARRRQDVAEMAAAR